VPLLRIAPLGVGRHLWILSGKPPARPVELDALEISEALADAIEAWGDAWDAVADPGGGPAARFPSAGAEEEWRAEGLRLAGALRRELGEEWEVEAAF
jgi:hypothetical protein